MPLTAWMRSPSLHRYPEAPNLKLPEMALNVGKPGQIYLESTQKV